MGLMEKNVAYFYLNVFQSLKITFKVHDFLQFFSKNDHGLSFFQVYTEKKIE
jgi:hypothetical protein